MRARELFEFDNPQIYCDMDGVLADFHKFTDEYHGEPFNNSLWATAPEHFFLHLPPMPDAHVLWQFISKYDPIILTAVPKEEHGQHTAADDKAQWMKQHFGHTGTVHAVNRKGKQHFAIDGRDGRPNILIDDHPVNIREFNAKNGIGIHHTSAQSSIARLKEIGFK